MPDCLYFRSSRFFFRGGLTRLLFLRNVVNRSLRLPALILLFAVLSGCFRVHIPFTPTSLDIVQAEKLISIMKEQEQAVSSFSSTGSIILEGWIWDSSAEILIAGTKDPFRIKLEITHSWGRPLLHILIKDDILQVLEFGEKRLYSGEFSAETLSRFLPVGYYDKETIWAMLRGYPEMLTYQDLRMPSPAKINLLNLLGNIIKVIEFFPENRELKSVSFPGHPQELSFSNFRESGDISYASEVRLENIRRGRPLVLRRNRAVFNREIPDQFFNIEKPSGFETVFFDEIN